MNEHIVVDCIRTLELINYQLADLKVRKEKLEKEIINNIGHNHEGQRTYKYDIYKVTIKTPLIAKLDVEIYKKNIHLISKKLNPVVQSTDYKISKSKLNHFNAVASNEERLLLSEFIVEVPGNKKIEIGVQG